MTKQYLLFFLIGAFMYGCADLATCRWLSMFCSSPKSETQIDRHVTVLALLTGAMIVALAVFGAEFNDLGPTCRAEAFADGNDGPLGLMSVSLVGLSMAIWGMVAASCAYTTNTTFDAVAPWYRISQTQLPYQHQTVLCWATWGLLILSPLIVMQLIGTADLVCYGSGAS